MEWCNRKNVVEKKGFENGHDGTCDWVVEKLSWELGSAPGLLWGICCLKLH